jgi:hypothetical protein
MHRNNTSYTTNSSALTNNTTRSSHSQQHSGSLSFKSKLYPNCISGSSGDADEASSDEEQGHAPDNSELDENESPNNNSISIESSMPNGIENSTPIKPMFQVGSMAKCNAKKNLLNSTLKSNKSSTVLQPEMGNGCFLLTNNCILFFNMQLSFFKITTTTVTIS